MTAPDDRLLDKLLRELKSCGVYTRKPGFATLGIWNCFVQLQAA